MVTEIETIDGSQKDTLLRWANIKKIFKTEKKNLSRKTQKKGFILWKCFESKNQTNKNIFLNFGNGGSFREMMSALVYMN